MNFLVAKMQTKDQSRKNMPHFSKLLVIAACLSLSHFSFADPVPLKAQPGASSAVAPQDIDPQVFVDFREWTETYLAAETIEDKTALAARGVELARARRAGMFQYIVFDPQRAFKVAVPMHVKQQLPAVVVDELEKRLSSRSEYNVLAALYEDKETRKFSTRIRRSVVLNGKAYHASVYDRRLGVTTKKQMAWHGIALDDYIALFKSPVRSIELDETIDREAEIGNKRLCPVCGKDAANGVAADIGGVIYYFDVKEHLAELRSNIEKQEDIIGPDVDGLELLETATRIAEKENPKLQ